MKHNYHSFARQIVLCVLLASLLPFILSGCGSKSSGVEASGALIPVTLNEVAHSIFYAPMYVAIENGYFEEEGIDLTLVTGYGADKTMTALLTGEADIGFCGSESSIYTYLGGTADYAVNFAQLTQRAGNFLVARTADENFTYDKLIGKSVLGGRAGGMPQMVFEYILRKNGIEPSEILIDQSVDFGSTAAAFSGNTSYEYTVEFEPYATSLVEKGDGYIVASLGTDSGYVPYTAFCARKSYLENNSDTVLAFTKAIQKGLDYTNSHTPEEIAAVIKPQFSEMNDSTLTAIVTRYYEQDTWKENLIFEQESFELLENILKDAGELDEYVPYEDLVTTQYAVEAAK